MATKDPTKTYWDWSTAGQDLPEDHYTYLKIKGNFVYDTNVEPTYRWYNETDAYRYILGDTIVPTETTNINLPGGSIDDPTARIFPFKVHVAKQPYDTVNNTLLVPLTSGEGGFWTTFDWPSALKLGAEANGIDFSGNMALPRPPCTGRPRIWCSPPPAPCSAKTATARTGAWTGPRLATLATRSSGAAASTSKTSNQPLPTATEPPPVSSPAAGCIMNRRNTARILISISTVAIVAVLMLGARQLLAQTAQPPAPKLDQLHPQITLLDANGANVLETGQAVSPMKTCGQCHDADYIASHSFHADLGLTAMGPVSPTNSCRHLGQLGSADLSLPVAARRRPPGPEHSRLA